VPLMKPPPLLLIAAPAAGRTCAAAAAAGAVARDACGFSHGSQLGAASIMPRLVCALQAAAAAAAAAAVRSKR